MLWTELNQIYAIPIYREKERSAQALLHVNGSIALSFVLTQKRFLCTPGAVRADFLCSHLKFLLGLLLISIRQSAFSSTSSESFPSCEVNTFVPAPMLPWLYCHLPTLLTPYQSGRSNNGDTSQLETGGCHSSLESYPSYLEVHGEVSHTLVSLVDHEEITHSVIETQERDTTVLQDMKLMVEPIFIVPFPLCTPYSTPGSHHMPVFTNPVTLSSISLSDNPLQSQCRAILRLQLPKTYLIMTRSSPSQTLVIISIHTSMIPSISADLTKKEEGHYDAPYLA